MKKLVLVLSIILINVTSCSLSDDSNNNEPVIITINEWNMINVTGGVSGVDHDFQIGDIVWVFDNNNSILNINNNNENADLEDGLDSGNYNLFFHEHNEDLFLIVEGVEFGEIKISGDDNDDMTIDQNSLSTGTGSDGYVYTFKRTTRTVEL